MRIAKIPYLNTRPYFHFLSERWLSRHTIISATPKQLGDKARAGELDAGCFSLIDAAGLVGSGDFEYLGDLGIAGLGPIQSILLCGVRDPKRLEGKAIAVTSHTATTSRLMELWLKEKIGIQAWDRVEPGQPAAGILLIGDDALSRKLRPLPGDPEPIDLCAAWTEWTGLPFVFARWAVRKSLPDSEKRELLGAMQSAVELAIDDLEIVAERAAEDNAFEADFIIRYLQGIRYRLNADDEAGMGLFMQKLGALTAK